MTDPDLSLAPVITLRGCRRRSHGARSEFEAGAFGDLAGQDLIANRMHERPAILARTDAGYIVRNSRFGFDFRNRVAQDSVGAIDGL